MFKRIFTVLTLLVASYLTGCASVPMESHAFDLARKQFSPPSAGMAGLYIYRNETMHGALLKSIYIDGKLIAESGPMTYFYIEVKPGQHKLSTESAVGQNDLIVNFESGMNYFVRQEMRVGLVGGGATLELFPEDIGKAAVLECKLAKLLADIQVVKDVAQ